MIIDEMKKILEQELSKMFMSVNVSSSVNDDVITFNMHISDNLLLDCEMKELLGIKEKYNFKNFYLLIDYSTEKSLIVFTYQKSVSD